MSREKWELIKHAKNFNVRIFRKGTTTLIGSLIVNVLLVIMIFYVYINQPLRDFYATNGEMPPIKLTAMLEENKKSTALLPPDPPEENVQKEIPE